MLDFGFKIMIVAVAAEGMGKEWLGRNVDETCVDDLVELHQRHGINVAGEGGEFETLVLDSPLFKKPLIVEETKKEWRRDSGTLTVIKARLG